MHSLTAPFCVMSIKIPNMSPLLLNIIKACRIRCFKNVTMFAIQIRLLFNSSNGRKCIIFIFKSTQRRNVSESERASAKPAWQVKNIVTVFLLLNCPSYTFAAEIICATIDTNETFKTWPIMTRHIIGHRSYVELSFEAFLKHDPNKSVALDLKVFLSRQLHYENIKSKGWKDLSEPV